MYVNTTGHHSWRLSLKALLITYHPSSLAAIAMETVHNPPSNAFAKGCPPLCTILLLPVQMLSTELSSSDHDYSSSLIPDPA